MCQSHRGLKPLIVQAFQDSNMAVPNELDNVFDKF